MIDKFKGLWVEKYRPKTLDDMCISDFNKHMILDWKENMQIPHLLLTGKSGIGKTTIAQIICNDILNCDYLYINASDESGIDTIRTKVSGFVQTKSFDGSIKVVVLDEGDRLTSSSLDCLRNLMESYSEYARFIITGNYGHKITTAIKSRTQKMDMTPSIKDIGRRVMDILKLEKIVMEKSQLPLLQEIIKRKFPDIRDTINTVQTYCSGGILQIQETSNVDILCESIFLKIKKGETLKLRKDVISKEREFSNDYPHLLKSLLEYYYTVDMPEINKKQSLICISEYLYKSAIVVDQEINFFACVLQLEELID